MSTLRIGRATAFGKLEGTLAELPAILKELGEGVA